MYRISHNIEDIGNADTIDDIREIVRRNPPGRFLIVEVRAEPFPSGHTIRAWGRMHKYSDGQVEDEPWPWRE